MSVANDAHSTAYVEYVAQTSFDQLDRDQVRTDVVQVVSSMSAVQDQPRRLRRSQLPQPHHQRCKQRCVLCNLWSGRSGSPGKTY